MNLGKTINTMKVKQDKMEAELLSLRQLMNNCSSELKLRPTKPEVSELVKATSTDLSKEIKRRPTKTEVLAIIETKLAEHAANLADKDKENERTWAELASKHVETKMSQVTVNLSEVQKTLEDTENRAQEQKERDARSNNIIIYRVPETSDSTEERIKQDRA